MIVSRGARRIALAALIPALAAFCALSCGGGKDGAPPKKDSTPSLAGNWQCDLEAVDRTIARTRYRIEQAGDSASIHLVSTLSPAGAELVPEAMTFVARGTWSRDALRLQAVSWVSGRDTCSFALTGKISPEGRLLLFFPADICGERSLPFTRTLYQVE